MTESDDLLPPVPFGSGVSDGMASTCDRCNRVPVFDWHVDDDAWLEVCPEESLRRVLCLGCFVYYCEARGVQIEDRLEFVDLATPSVSMRFDAKTAEVYRWTAGYGESEQEG